MDGERRHLLSASSTGSGVSLQEPRSARDEPQLYSPLTTRASETDTTAVLAPELPGRAATGDEEEDVVSLRSRGSSVSTTTDDQAALLRKNLQESTPPQSRRTKSANGRRVLPLERVNTQPELADNTRGLPTEAEERRIKSAAPWLGRSRVRVAPASLDDDDVRSSPSSSIKAWEAIPDSTNSLLTSQATSQTSLPSSSGKRDPPLIGRAKVRVSPAPPTDEADCASSSVTSRVDVFISDGVKVEETTGEQVVESVNDSTSSTVSRLEVPHCVEHQPYIPLQTAQMAIERVANDMHTMKAEHIELVERMQNAYREIEEGSKVQYREYVQQLKKQHGTKVTVYRQVVKLLQDELENLREYWEGTANSLANSNRNLLLENKGLYQQLKDGAEQMKMEKEQSVKELTERIEAERRKREAESREAQEEINALQTECSDKVRLTEREAEERLAKERALHVQSVEELKKQLARGQARLKELERGLAIEKTSGKESQQIVISKTVESVPLLTPAEDDTVPTAKSETQASQKEEMRLKKRIGRTEKDLRQARGQLKSMMTLLSSDPRLRGALETGMEEITREIDTLKDEREELKRELDDNEGTRDENSIHEKELRLSFVESQLTDLEERLKLMQYLKSTEASTSTLPSSSVRPVEHLAAVSGVQAEDHPPPDGDNGNELKERDEAVANEDGEKNSSALSVAASIEEETRLGEEDDQESDQEGKMEGDMEPDENEESEDERPHVEPDMEIGEPDVGIGDEQSSTHEISTSEAEPTQSHPRDVKFSPQQKATSKQSNDRSEELNKLREQLKDYQNQQQADRNRIKSLQKELKVSSKGAGGGAGGGASSDDKRELKKKEKEIKELNRKQEVAKKNLEKIQAQLKSTDAELTSLKKDNEKLLAEMKEKNAEFEKLSAAAKNAVEATEKAKMFEEQVKKQVAEIKTLSENYNSERILRKKYYNLIEDMKGKIRVYCRVRPLSGSEKARNNFSVIESPDEYTLNVKTTKGVKEFQFDQVFTPEESQTRVFEDTKNLIQSAVDGYNVCIFAYGQTGSGKTYTMIGGKDGNNQIVAPGIAPRAFETIFQLVEENRSKFDFSISCYMLELYNDKLLDLFQTSHKEPPRLDIKKDKKGLVVVNGAVVHQAHSTASLMELFELGSKNRHVSSTKMNAESSRSHLVVGIVIESTNSTNGTVHRGKLSIVDLAGSERASKTGATPEQLREAQSINKSLSALGDVISALSSGQDFVPYRNNKLTMLMQDSLGGNAKTLMFVNISPADYNAEETVVSLTYAARVKLITNDASKNADNKEIARLKGIIAKLKKGEAVEEED